MSPATLMRRTVQRYIEHRRRLGFGMTAPATELMRFARYADARRHRGPLTQELLLGWAQEHVRRTSVVTAARRLEVVRPFATYYRQFEPDTDIPPLGVLGRGHRRLVPHIYTDEELDGLLQAATELTPRGDLRPMTYRTLFGLIAATGLRVSEAVNLTLADVDLTAGTLTVRETKYRKSRRLPLHRSTVQALRLYHQARGRCHGGGADAPFFVSKAGLTLQVRTVEHVFQCLRSRLNWRARGDFPHPRIHDLRHNSESRIIPSAASIALGNWRRSSTCAGSGA